MPRISYYLQELWGEEYGPVYAATMGKKRFQFLLSHLRMDDIDVRVDGKKHDKFQLARDVFEKFNEACSKALQCGEQLCIDETLYANRGRGFQFKQFNPSKPAKYGFLYKSLNDSVHPYTYRSHIYAGCPEEEPTEHYVQGTEEAVEYLLDGYAKCHELKGRNLTTDRFYSSLDLAKLVMEKYGMTFVGTLNANRKGLPDAFKFTAGREDGDYMVLYELKDPADKSSGKMSLHSYIVQSKSGTGPKKNVMLLTTTVPIVGWTKDGGTEKPALICFYNFAMLGTDRVDQIQSWFTVRMKSKRWPMSVFSYMMDTARVNARTISKLQEVIQYFIYISKRISNFV